MKIVPPVELMEYISFEDDKVVLIQELPKHLKFKYKRFCKKMERVERRRQKKLRNLIKNSKKN